MITLLITGVGGPIGQAMIKAARASAIPCRIVGTDRSALSTGLGWVDRASVLPDATAQEEYLREMHRLCAEEGVTLVLPGSERELALLVEDAAALKKATGALVVASSSDVLHVALDKLETFRFLETHGLNFPRTVLCKDSAAVERLIDEVGFPLIAKPRRGSGSRGLLCVHTRDDLTYVCTLCEETLLQEYLRPDEQEYTVAVYTQRDGRQAGSICLKRELAAGNTYRAWVDQNPVLLREAERVVRALGATGPCNVQLRLTERGPITFEINARFSGTTAMRAHFGFNEVEMAIRDLALAETLPEPLVRPGIALRFWDEVYLNAHGQKETLSSISHSPKMSTLRTAQAGEWSAVLSRMQGHDFYFLPAYHGLAEKRGEGEARLFVYEEEGYTMALPLMLRALAEVPELGKAAGEWRDATSVYGYAGPIASHERLPERVVRGFEAALTETLRELRVVCAFSRLHPLFEQSALLAGFGECRPGGQTVSIDLTQSSEAQWAQYSATTRTRLHRLRRLKVHCAVDSEKRHLSEFVNIYYETMRRVGARQAYFFEPEYFTHLVESLGNVLQLFVAKTADGEIVGGGLFTLCDGIVQYHLGGTRDSALKISPMALVIDAVRLWANGQRARVLHLGGGVGSAADSLFQFKTGFAKRRHDFATWRWTIMPEIYGALTRERGRWDAASGLEPGSAEFFPSYRCAGRPRSGLTRALTLEPELVTPPPAVVEHHG